MFLERELDGYYEECLQCSYSRELNGIAVKYEGRSAQTEKRSPIAEGYELSPGRSYLKYSWIRHEPVSSRDVADDFGNGDKMEPSQDWKHHPTGIIKRLKKIGAKLLYFGSE